MSTPSVKESCPSYLAAAAELVATASDSSFDTERFFEKFELLSNTPNAIESLRGLIRNLAIDGKFEPSSTDAAAVKLEDLAIKINSGATPNGGRKAYVESGVPLIRSMNVHFHGFVKEGLVFLTDRQADSLSNAVVEKDDVLLNITGASIGRVAVAPAEMHGARVNQHVTIIRPKEILFPAYLALYLASPKTQQFIDSIQVGATRQALTKGMIQNFKIPVPPVAEQKRIVAKVDELMGFCDSLEALEAERSQRHASLSRAALARFADFPTSTNLQFLFHNSFDIKPSELRKAIRTQAVFGKLVTRDSKDELVSLVLKREAERKIENVRLGKARNEHSLAPIPEDSFPCEIPQSWEWCKIDKLVHSLRNDIRTGPFGSTLKKHEHRKCGIPVWGIESIDKNGGFTGVNKIFVDEEKAAELVAFSVKSGDVIISRSGTVGELCRIPDDAPAGLISTNLLKISLNSNVVNGDYFALLFRGAESITRQLSQLCLGSTRIFLTQKILSQLLFPIPPLAEQKRIVAKVEGLMALVEQLEQQLADSRTLGQQLLEAVVAQLTATPQAN